MAEPAHRRSARHPRPAATANGRRATPARGTAGRPGPSPPLALTGRPPRRPGRRSARRGRATIDGRRLGRARCRRRSRCGRCRVDAPNRAQGEAGWPRTPSPSDVASGRLRSVRWRLLRTGPPRSAARGRRRPTTDPVRRGRCRRGPGDHCHQTMAGMATATSGVRRRRAVSTRTGAAMNMPRRVALWPPAGWARRSSRRMPRRRGRRRAYHAFAGGQEDDRRDGEPRPGQRTGAERKLTTLREHRCGERHRADCNRRQGEHADSSRVQRPLSARASITAATGLAGAVRTRAPRRGPAGGVARRPGPPGCADGQAEGEGQPTDGDVHHRAGGEEQARRQRAALIDAAPGRGRTRRRPRS